MMSQDENHGFGGIPRKRDTTFVTTSSLMLVAVFYVSVVIIEKPHCVLLDAGLGADNSSAAHLGLLHSFAAVYQISFLTTVAVLTHVLSEVVRRLCVLTEEYQHVNGRYDGSVWAAVKATFRMRAFAPLAVLLVTCCMILFAMVLVTGSLFWAYLRVYLDLIVMYCGYGATCTYFLPSMLLKRY